MQCALALGGTGQDMEDDPQTSSEPTWLDPRIDRKTPFTDAKLEVFANDFITGMAGRRVSTNSATTRQASWPRSHTPSRCSPGRGRC